MVAVTDARPNKETCICASIRPFVSSFLQSIIWPGVGCSALPSLISDRSYFPSAEGQDGGWCLSEDSGRFVPSLLSTSRGRCDTNSPFLVFFFISLIHQRDDDEALTRLLHADLSVSGRFTNTGQVDCLGMHCD